MNLKANLSNTLRRLRLLSLSDRLRFYAIKTANSRKNKSFAHANPAINIPPDYFLYETYGLDYKSYYDDGLDTAKEIVEIINPFFDISKQGSKVLDWGCGPGRVSRHLPGLLPFAHIFATDYNNQYINWCIKNIEGVAFSHNSIVPPVQFASGYFDVIIGLSIFTHLSEEYHIKWVQEFSRLLKPGAVAFITTQGNAYRAKLSLTEQQEFDAGKLIVRGNVKNGNRLFSAFHPADFMRNLLGKDFDILLHYPGSVNGARVEQDKWLIRRKNDS